MSTLYILALSAITVGVTYATFTAQCRRCICVAEGCDTLLSTCNGQSPEGCGPYQITQQYWCDGNNMDAVVCAASETEWRTCSQDLACANDTVDGYMARYGPTCKPEGDLGCEDYAKMHKGGPFGCQVDTGAPQAFWQAVSNCCSDALPTIC